MSGIRDKWDFLGRKKFIRVIRPTTGDVWRIGEQYNILWEKSRGLTPKVHIGLFKTERRYKRLIKRGAPNTGHFEWTIPNVTPGTYIVAIATTDLEVYDFGERFRIGASYADAAAIGAGERASFAVRNSDKSVWAWGLNGGFGLLGDGVLNEASSVPVMVSGLNRVTQLDAAYRYVLALDDNEIVWVWGDNFYGNPGQGGPCDPYTPWAGLDTPTQIPGLSQITKISAGLWAMALKNDGSVWVWGNCEYAAYPGGTQPIQVQNLQNIIDIAAGGNHCLALDANGDVWSWGYNNVGQLGDGTSNDRQAPVSVLSDATAIAAGRSHSLAMKSDKTLWAWGHNYHGEIGNGTVSYAERSPVRVNDMEIYDVRKIAAKRYGCYAISSENELWAWGDNSDGQFGSGSTIGTNPNPVMIHDGVADVAPGWRHTIFVKVDGSVWASGWNYFGQLGDGTTLNRLSAVQVLLYD